MCTQSLPCLKYNSGSVTMWYSRPPTSPNGTAHVAIWLTVDEWPPRARHRRSAIAMATKTPMMMQNA